jgi:hypothetical protein
MNPSEYICTGMVLVRMQGIYSSSIVHGGCCQGLITHAALYSQNHLSSSALYAPPAAGVSCTTFLNALLNRVVDPMESIRIGIQHFSLIRIQTHKIIESGSNADPDPQQNF